MKLTNQARMALTILFALCSVAGFSQQFHIGYSPDEVIGQANASNGVQISKRHTQDGELCISWRNIDMGIETWVYFHEGVSQSTVIFPFGREEISQWKTVFNRKFAKRSPNEWVAYFEGMTLLIDFTYLSSASSYVFYITQEKEAP